MFKNLLNHHANLIISIDDYSERNIELAEKIKEIGFVAIFYLDLFPAGAREQVEQLHAMGHQIGSHTIHHPADLKAISIDQARTEIFASKAIIEDITGEPCTTFAYPRGRHNEQVRELVKMAGYESARTTLVGQKGSEDPYQTHTTIHVYSGRKEYAGRPWMMMADFHLSDIVKNGGDFHIWGHAEEMHNNGDTGNFIELLKRVHETSLKRHSVSLQK